MDINMLLIVVFAVVVLLLFLWPREEKKQERAAREPRCACSNCECNGETIILKEKKK